MWASGFGRRACGYLPLAFALVLVLSIWSAFPHEFVASDEWSYANKAWLLLQGRIAELSAESTVFAHRPAVYAPVAAVYALLPVSPRTTNLVPLLALCAILVVVWSALGELRSRMFALFFAASCVPLLQGATALLPDILVTAFVTASLWLLSKRKQQRRARQTLYGALGVALLFCGFLAKETACWALPVWLACLLADGWRRAADCKAFYLSALLASLLLCAGYLCLCQAMFDDPLARLSSVQAVAHRHHWRIRNDEQLWARLSVDPLLFFWRQFGLLGPVAVLSYPLLRPEARLWYLYALCALLSFWFGSVSTTAYQPLPLRPRMVLPFVPALCIVAGQAVARLPLPRLAESWKRDALLLVLLCAVQAPRLVRYVSEWQRNPERAAMKKIAREVRSQPDSRFLLIGGSPRAEEFLPIYFNFEPPPNLTISSAKGLCKHVLREADQAFLLKQTKGGDRKVLKRSARALKKLGLPLWYSRNETLVYATRELERVRPLLRRAKKRRCCQPASMP